MKGPAAFVLIALCGGVWSTTGVLAGLGSFEGHGSYVGTPAGDRSTKIALSNKQQRLGVGCRVNTDMICGAKAMYSRHRAEQKQKQKEEEKKEEKQKRDITDLNNERDAAVQAFLQQITHNCAKTAKECTEKTHESLEKIQQFVKEQESLNETLTQAFEQFKQQQQQQQQQPRKDDDSTARYEFVSQRIETLGQQFETLVQQLEMQQLEMQQLEMRKDASQADASSLEPILKQCEAIAKQCGGSAQHCEELLKNCEASTKQSEASAKYCQGLVQDCETSVQHWYTQQSQFTQQSQVSRETCQALAQQCETLMKQCEQSKDFIHEQANTQASESAEFYERKLNELSEDFSARVQTLSKKIDDTQELYAEIMRLLRQYSMDLNELKQAFADNFAKVQEKEENRNRNDREMAALVQSCQDQTKQLVIAMNHFRPPEESEQLTLTPGMQGYQAATTATYQGAEGRLNHEQSKSKAGIVLAAGSLCGLILFSSILFFLLCRTQHAKQRDSSAHGSQK